MAPPFFVCLRRGLLNVAANWQIAALYLVQSVVVSVLVVAGFLPILLAIGASVLASILDADSAAEAIDRLPALLAALGGVLAPLAFGLLVASLVWTAAMVVFCYFQGAFYGVLAAGDRRAPYAPEPALADFRVFDLARFHAAGRRLTWRYFWLLNLFVALFTVAVALLAAGAAGLGAAAGGGREAGPLLAAGCLVAGIFALVVLALTLWMAVAQAEAARERGGVWVSVGRALGVLRRRLGAVLAAAVLFVVASMAASLAGMPLWWLAGGWGYDSWSGWLGAELGLGLLQWALSGLVSLALAGVLVALVRGEAAADDAAGGLEA